MTEGRAQHGLAQPVLKLFFLPFCYRAAPLPAVALAGHLTRRHVSEQGAPGCCVTNRLKPSGCKQFTLCHDSGLRVRALRDQSRVRVVFTEAAGWAGPLCRQSGPLPMGPCPSPGRYGEVRKTNVVVTGASPGH